MTNDLQYDSRSAFTLSLNHRDTFTGITDRDRSLTTRRFSELWPEGISCSLTSFFSLVFRLYKKVLTGVFGEE